MNIKDSFIHLGPGGQNKKALLKDFAITENGITLTRANLLIENNVEVDETLTLSIPTWNLNTTGSAKYLDSLGRLTSADIIACNNPYKSRVYSILSSSSMTTGKPGADGYILGFSWDTTSGWGALLFIQHTTNPIMLIRGANGTEGNSTWGNWITILSSSNYTDYVYSKNLGDARYVLKAGDTMTGALTVPSLSVTGAATFSQAINGSILGNAATASRLQNARTISLTGSVTGSGSFDGSGNLSITTTTNHSHSQYLPLAGGLMTGPLTWADNTALSEQTSPIYFLSVDAFTDGGTTKWVSKLNTQKALGIKNSSGNDVYLPLAGGTMTGDITMTNGKSIILTNYTTASSFDDVDRGIPFSLTNAPAKIAYTCTDTNKGLTFNPNTGALKSGSFVKRGGTSSQFLKADGSVDSNTYLTSSTNITNIAWTEKLDDANYPVAFSPNTTPTTSNNGYNTGFTFNPGTKTFNNNGCRLQYDSTNKVLKFIFD